MITLGISHTKGLIEETALQALQYVNFILNVRNIARLQKDMHIAHYH